MNKKILVFILIAFSLILPVQTVMAKEPVRLVVLPIIMTQNASISDEGLALMKTKISRAMHVPLNGTLQRVEYIPSNLSSLAFQEIWSRIYNTNDKAKIKDVIKPLANELNADFVVCTVLYRCSQMSSMSMSLDHSEIIISDAAVEMFVFDNRTGELINKRTSRYYRDEYSPHGTSDALAVECLMYLIEELKPRERMLNEN